MKNKSGLESFGAATGQTPPAPTLDNLGKVEISPEAIATVAANAVMEKGYGVVGIAAPRLKNGRAEMLPTPRSKDGILVRIENNEIIIDLFVIIQYGIRISEVAHNIMQNVKFEVESHLGMAVSQVNVNVQGLHKE
ncbi:Asp23/Gls24 family envelope stress response protein [Candidatus Chlorohelix sp.]|uniref:Asp23/Gls24 family envelope stress response protein n=1 Tax=Candidatus Chlorohelix sp. TaxID=3139201 RepID=UPI003044AC07